jgi:hypothetical protein
MVSRWVRSWDSRLLAPVLSVLSGIGVTPNMLTDEGRRIIQRC